MFMHVEEERDDGIVVSGAKVVATGSALTHYNFIAHYGPIPVQKKEYALVRAVSMDTPGVKLICRPSYEMTAEVMGSPLDYRFPAGSTRTTRSSSSTGLYNSCPLQRGCSSVG